MDEVFKGLDALDKDDLVGRMAEELPEIRERLGISAELLAKKTGMSKEHLEQAEAGESSLKWSEYMSLLFVIWNNDIGRGIIEAKGLFPDVLKKAMSVNKNAHAPLTESAKFGF